MARKNVYKMRLSDSNFFHTYYDQCTFSKCNYKFQEADWTYFGKDNDGNWQHVCENHRASIQWVALQIFGHLTKEVYRVESYTVPSYSNPPQPDTDLSLWRYMNFDKFKSFIEKKTIFFPKAITFEDPLECAVSIKNNKDSLHQLRINAYPYFYGDELNDLSGQEKRKKIDEKIHQEVKENEIFRKKVLVSCWHVNDYESIAMWKLYKGRYNHTCAISISMCNLRNALPKPIHIGEVGYETYEKVYPTKVRVFKKHISFEHEKEIRAVIFPEHINNKNIEDITADKNENGLFIKPDEKYLEVKVHISPWSSKEFKKKIKSLIETSNWNIESESNPSLRIIETEYAPIY